MAPTSTPTVKPQPTDAAYGIDVLKLLPEFSRATYADAFGIDPDSFDPALPVKTWFDSSADPNKPYSYISLMPNGLAEPIKASITIPGAQAAKVNMPGVHKYPAYLIAPTTASVSSSIGIANTIPPEYLSTSPQALAMAAELGLDARAVSQYEAPPSFTLKYPSDEDRREWLITFRGIEIPVGKLLQEKNANGVGAPGSWHVGGPEPNWISSLPTLIDPVTPVQPVPMRELLPNEAFRVGLMGVSIVRTDWVVGGAGAGSGSGQGDSALVQKMAADVAAIKAYFRVPSV